jgi:hypothetical protein
MHEPQKVRDISTSNINIYLDRYIAHPVIP